MNKEMLEDFDVTEIKLEEEMTLQNHPHKPFDTLYLMHKNNTLHKLIIMQKNQKNLIFDISGRTDIEPSLKEFLSKHIDLKKWKKIGDQNQK